MRWLTILALLSGCDEVFGLSDTPGGRSDGSVGAVTVDSVAIAKTNGGATLSWSHTASGTDRLVIVGVSWKSTGTSISDVTYGGMTLTPIGSRVNTTKNIAISMYQLVAPPLGPQLVSMTFAPLGNDAIAASISLSNVDQVRPTGPFISAIGGNSPAMVTVTSATTDVVIDTLAVDTNPNSLSAGPGQMDRWNLLQGMWGAGSTTPGAPSITTSWTFEGADDDWALGAITVIGT